MEWVLEDIRKLLPILLRVTMTLWLCFFKSLPVLFFLSCEVICLRLLKSTFSQALRQPTTSRSKYVYSSACYMDLSAGLCGISAWVVMSAGIVPLCVSQILSAYCIPDFL